MPIDRGNYMQTFTGRAYYPEDPRPEDFCIEDIAHALGNICRYAGHGRFFYSVAEHSWHVSQLVPPKIALIALMHDASEAYVSDLPRPVKRLLQGYRDLEQRTWVAIAAAFKLPEEMPEEVHHADVAMLYSEHDQLLPPVPDGLKWGMGLVTPITRRPVITGWGPKFAKFMFTERYKELTQ